MEDYIELKWGTLKGWSLNRQESRDILQKYLDLGVSMSCMVQDDTPEQKELLLELIAQHDGHIYNDWSGEAYTKEQAIDYLKNYKS